MKYQLKNLLDIPRLKDLFESFDEIHSMPSAIIDIDGNVLIANSWQDICTRFHRINPETEKKCIESDTHIRAELDRNSPSVIYRCPMGLVDSAIPLILDGEHLGNVFTGQLFIDPPDETRFIEQARMYGFDEQEYLAAMRKVPCFTEAHMRRNLEFIHKLTLMLAEQGLHHRKRDDAREELFHSERKLKEAQRIAGLGSWELDLVSGTLYWSDEVFLLFEIDPHMFGASYQAFLDAIHPDDRAAVNRAYTTSLTNRSPYEIEHRLLMKDGRVKYVIERCESVFAPDGTPLRSAGTIQDVTGRKRIEDALRESQEKYHAFVTRSQEAIYCTELDEPVDISLPVEQQIDEIYERAYLGECNVAMAKMYGLPSVEHFIGRRLVDFHGGSGNQVNRAGFRRFIESGYRSEGCETEEITPEGAPRYFLSTDTGIVENGRLMRIWGTAVDITDRKNAEIALRSREKQLNYLLSSSPAVLYTCGLKDEFDATFVSDNISIQFGYSANEALSAGFWAGRIHPEDRDRVFTGLGDWSKEGAYSHEYRFQLKDGSYRWVHDEIRVLHDSQGRPVEMIGAWLDVTELRRTREDLYLAQVSVDKASDAVIWVKSGDRIFDANQAACRMLGYSREELLLLRIPEISPHFEDHDWSCRLFPELRAKGSLMFEAQLQKKDGGSVPVDVSLNYLRFNGEDLICGFIRDISERRKSEQELQNALMLNRHIIASAQEGIIVYDKELRYILWNPYMEQLTGLTFEDVVGKTPQMFPFMVENGIVDDLQKVLKNEVVAQREFNDRIPATGRDGWVIQLNAPLRDSNHDIIGVISIVRDVTQLKKTAEQLQQAQKMESIGQLAGGVAHDFNNMLSVILGHTELALMQTESADPLHGDLLQIHAAAERSADLTRQLLAFARKQAISPVVINLNETVSAMLKMLKRLIGESIQLTFNADADLWRIKMDPSQIDQILANLCVNARDAINTGGRITIVSENSVIDDRQCQENPDAQPGEYVRLKVIDDGCGMDRETVHHIFEPFFTTKEPGKGTGLGLATVFGIVRQNNGFIDVDSVPGQGTSFIIHLPRYSERESVPPENARVPLRTGNETILVVEDEPAILRVAAIMLAGQGYTVLTAETPAEAIRVSGGHTGMIHLLMTDVIMPEMNGKDLARRLQAMNPGIKVLYMSGYTADIIDQHGVLDSEIHFLQKPFSLSDLTAKIRAALE